MESNVIFQTYPDGVLTQHLARMKVEDTIGIRGPKGAFTYTPNMVREIGMVAGNKQMYSILKHTKNFILSRWYRYHTNVTGRV